MADAVPVRAAVRRSESAFSPLASVAKVGAIDAATDCVARTRALATLSTVPPAYSCFMTKPTIRSPPFAQSIAKVLPTVTEQAVAADVRRFVFVSSIGVSGAETFDTRFRATDTPRPMTPYAVSKLEAELSLQSIARRTGLVLAVLQPPLIYGPDAPGNFAALVRVVQRGVAPPSGAIHNRRSFVAIDNLVDLTASLLGRQADAEGTFLVSDDDMSLTELRAALHVLWASRPACGRCRTGGCAGLPI